MADDDRVAARERDRTRRRDEERRVTAAASTLGDITVLPGMGPDSEVEPGKIPKKGKKKHKGKKSDDKHVPSPVGWALGGAVIGGLASAFLGYGLIPGAVLGGGGGYAYGMVEANKSEKDEKKTGKKADKPKG